MILIRLFKAIELFGFFIKELIISNFKVARVVFTPGMDIQTGFLKLPLSLKTDLGITALAQMITLTPDTLSVDVSEDRDYLLIYTMFAEKDKARQTQNLKEMYERRIREVFE
jgi:multicomponent Na+:H+ antiporter subunit E